MLLLKFLVDSKKISEVLKHWFQTLAYQGPNSRFVLKAIIKALISKSSQNSMLITLNHVHTNNDSQPNLNQSDYLNFHTCLHEYSRMLNEIRQTRSTNYKSRLLMCQLEYSNTWIPGRYSTWYSTSNKGRLSSYFQIMIPGWVICQSLIVF